MLYFIASLLLLTNVLGNNIYFPNSSSTTEYVKKLPINMYNVFLQSLNFIDYNETIKQDKLLMEFKKDDKLFIQNTFKLGKMFIEGYNNLEFNKYCKFDLTNYNLIDGNKFNNNFMGRLIQETIKCQYEQKCTIKKIIILATDITENLSIYEKYRMHKIIQSILKTVEEMIKETFELTMKDITVIFDCENYDDAKYLINNLFNNFNNTINKNMDLLCELLNYNNEDIINIINKIITYDF